ncbi:MAG: TfoX/Sxy family protein [Shimia sp.]|jgi:TfoX/Sxy family transcriptional regulator of competence genes|uniref:TfoX/Sxy family protein n=1 Tax=Shimia sp. TaxID=1954381 RepID=UPI0025D46767|nr:TfoX/Sxy family protein [Shimia sp.]MCH2069370.1 TfoX/Sxy family protein [Shimia sp.]
MAYDEGHATLMREDLADIDGITEKKMFGGLCFLHYGNMVCGVHKDGGMARVGKPREAEALEIEGVDPLSFTGRKMGGMVDLSEDLLGDDTRRAQVIALALTNAQSLPPK